MIKSEELSNPNSCINTAKEDEWVFVFKSKDPIAPDLIREWVKRRIEKGLNTKGDAKTEEALQCASFMEEYRSENY